MNYVEIEIHDDVFLPCYSHLRNDEGIDIDFIYGSRDSGKSRDTAMRLVEKCLTNDYFRHVLARKTFNTIKDSQWQVIKDVVEEWGLQDLFVFKTSPLEIDCINGNKFISRGFDNPQKIKSIQNPSGAWVEEGNELTSEDWIVLITSLRSNNGATKIDVTFNPECPGDFREFWLYKDYFSHTTEESFSHVKTITVGLESFDLHYRATHTTYNQNPYCTPQRKAVYEGLKTVSPYHYRIYALGKWGVRENKSPFVVTFNRDKHLDSGTIRKCVRDFNKPIYISFDFNRNPMCCSVIQWQGNVVRFLETIKLPNSTIYDMCTQIKIRYPKALIIVCGDYAGNQRSGLVQNQDLNNYWKVIKKELTLYDGQMQYIVNPSIEENEVLVNFCFANLDILINPEKCQALIFDLQFAEKMANGKLRKGDREDPTQQLDALDTARYFFNRYFAHLNPLKPKR